MPPSESNEPLRDAARHRAETTRKRAEKALTHAAQQRHPVTVAGIARTACVSRAWLYTQQDLLAAIREINTGDGSPARTGKQPASTDSLNRRLDAAQHRLAQLRTENRDLNQRLETAHAEIRRLRTATGNPPPP